MLGRATLHFAARVARHRMSEADGSAAKGGGDSRELLERAAAGDERAREELLERHLGELTAFVRLRLGAALRRRESSLDIAQSVCREALEDLAGFEYRGEQGFRNWLLLHAERKIRDRGRFWSRLKRSAHAERPLEGLDETDRRVHEQLRTLFTPSRDAVAREELERLEQAFRELPDDHRQVIVLVRVAGLSHAEVAREMDRTESATRTLLSRALARLAAAME